MASSVYLWFTTEVYYWRSIAATVWSVICLPVLLTAFHLMSRVSVTQPLLWLSGVWDGIVSLQFFVTLVLLTVAVVLVTWLSLPYFNVNPQIDSSPLSSLLMPFRWTHLPLLLISLVGGAIGSWGLSQLAVSGFGSLTQKKADTDVYVLNECHLFIVECGIFTGASYCMHFFMARRYHLAFPIIQRFKIFQVRSEARCLFSSSLSQTFHVVKYFYIFYFFLGGFIRSWIGSSFDINLDYDVAPLDSVYGMLNFSLFWQSYLVSLTLRCSWSLAASMARIFHTEQLEFQIDNVMLSSRECSLPDAMVCSYSPLLQHLAFYDLACLTKQSSPRVQELLSLSQPGGHPKTWMAVSSPAVAAVQDLAAAVKEENWAIMSRVPVNPRNGSSNLHTQPNQGDANTSGLSFRGQDNKRQENSETPEEPRPSFVTKWVTSLSSMPILSHLMSESLDTNSRRLFASCQLQIWAVECLSRIAVKSYTEDKYGVVQRSLPVLFSSLLELHEAMEKHFRLTSTVSRRSNGAVNPSDTMLRFKLHSAIKAGLYQMVNTYGTYIDDLRLTGEDTRRLVPFIDYTT